MDKDIIKCFCGHKYKGPLGVHSIARDGASLHLRCKVKNCSLNGSFIGMVDSKTDND